MQTYKSQKTSNIPNVPTINMTANGAINNVMQNHEDTSKYSAIHSIKKNTFQCGGGRTLNIDMTEVIPGPSFNGANTIGEECPIELSNISIKPTSIDFMNNLKSANPPLGYELSNPTIYLNKNNTNQVGGNNFIIDPVNNKKYYINSKNGRRVIKNYYKYYRAKKT